MFRQDFNLFLHILWTPNSLFSLVWTPSYHLALPLVERRRTSCLRHCTQQHFLASFLHSTSVEEVSLIFHSDDQYCNIERSTPFLLLPLAFSSSATWWRSHLLVTDCTSFFHFLLPNSPFHLFLACSRILLHPPIWRFSCPCQLKQRWAIIFTQGLNETILKWPREEDLLDINYVLPVFLYLAFLKECTEKLVKSTNSDMD